MLCPACQKVSKTGGKYKKLRGKYNPTGKRKRHPNLQWYTLPNGERIKLCTRCRRRATQDPHYLVRKGVIEREEARQ